MQGTRVVILLFLVILLLPLNGYAQTVDQCMAARKQEAVEICQGILDKGSRNADVYWQLSSQMFQTGDQSGSERVLNKALILHPGDKKLKNLKDNIASSSEEQRQLKASGQKNQSRVSQGRLKITCLTKSSSAGLQACQEYLQLTKVDGPKIETRIAKLENSLGITVASTTAAEPVTQSQPIVVESTPTQQNSSTTNNSRNSADRETAREIQTALNALGFNTGTPDGIPGAKTRSAALKFYQTVGLTPRRSFDSQMLTDVQDQQARLAVAKRRLDKSRRAATDQDPTLALSLLEEAENLSSLLSIPSGYRGNLKIQQAQLESASDSTQAQLALEQEQQRQEAQRVAEAQRLAQAERDRQAAAEAERLAQAERDRQAAEAERLAQAARDRQAAEAERLAQVARDRQAAEAVRLAQVARDRQAAEAERLAQAERDRQAAEAERLAQVERDRQAAEAERLAQLKRDGQIQEAKRQAEIEQERIRQESDRLAQLERDRLAAAAQLNQQAEGNQEFALLMRQIQSLESRLANHEASIALQINSIRSAVGDLFE